jgi:hypothetical protein
MPLATAKISNRANQVTHPANSDSHNQVNSRANSRVSNNPCPEKHSNSALSNLVGSPLNNRDNKRANSPVSNNLCQGNKGNRPVSNKVSNKGSSLASSHSKASAAASDWPVPTVPACSISY